MDEERPAKSDAERWNERYKARPFDPSLRPSRFLEEEVHRFKGSEALDVAMGTGQNAVFLAERGFHVTGVDVSSMAIQASRRRAKEHGVTLTTAKADLTVWRPTAKYDLITNFFFLERPLFPSLVAALMPGGHLVVEHFSKNNEEASTGPKNPAYLLESNELLHLAAGLKIVYYEDRVIDLEQGGHTGKAAIVRLIAQA